MSLWKIARMTRQAARYQSAAQHPTRFAKNRAKSKVLGAAGFWSAWARLWRA